MSSTARSPLPDEVLRHPALVALTERGSATGVISPDDLRLASEQAEVEPRHLKALLKHLSGQGISVEIGVQASLRAVAATSTRRTTTATAKAPATDDAPAKKAAAKKSASTARKAAAK